MKRNPFENKERERNEYKIKKSKNFKKEENEMMIEFYDEEINDQQHKEIELHEIQKCKEEKDEWISNQLEASGIKRKEYSNKIEEEEEIQIIIKKIYPKFLEGKIIKLRESKIQVPIKNENSDIVIRSKKGSETLIQFKSQKEKEKLSRKIIKEEKINENKKEKKINNKVK